MKDWLRNMFQLKKKLLSLAIGDCYLRKWNQMVSTSQKTSFNYLKYGPSLKISFRLYQWRFPLLGKTLNKRKWFLLARKPVSTSPNEGLCFKKNTFPLDGKKKLSLLRVSEKWRKKRLPLTRKLVSPSKNKLFLAGIFFKNWIPPNFKNGFH